MIHQPFDPLPYVLFSVTSIATGLLIELRAAAMHWNLGSGRRSDQSSSLLEGVSKLGR